MVDSPHHSTSTNTIAVIGAGALGSVFAAALVEAGNSVTLLGRRPTPDITVCEPPCSLQATALHVETEPASVAAAKFVLLLVKAYDTEQATRSIAPYLTPDATLITLQNGLGNVARIRSQLPDSQRVLAGVTSQAARRVSRGLVLHTGVGTTVVGYRNEAEHAAADCIAGILSKAGLPAAATGDVDRFIWQKVAINAAINGLTGVAGVPNGALVSRRSLFDASTALLDEAAAVASTYGYNLDSIHRLLRDTIAATAENHSSMLQDVDAGRRTEVDAIYGSLIDAGRARGLELPALTVIDALVRNIPGHAEDGEEPR